jgi:hypothetical protein
MEREKLEREIYQLTQIIAANAHALVSKSTSIADRAGLRRQIDIRTATWAGLLKQLSGDSSLSTAELRGPHAARSLCACSASMRLRGAALR